MKIIIAGLWAAVLILCVPRAAQGQVDLGPELALGDNVDLGIGGLVVAPLASVHPNLELAARFNLFFPDGFDYWEIDGDVRYLFPIEGNDQVVPYALAGLALGHSSFDSDPLGVGGGHGRTDLGLRLGGGVKAPMPQITPFAELGLGVGDIPDFTLRAGLTFLVGG